MRRRPAPKGDDLSWPVPPAEGGDLSWPVPSAEGDERGLAGLAWPALPASPTVLVPLGSTEQHGPPLPLHTDTTIATAVAQAVAARLQRDSVQAARLQRHSVLVAPAVA